MVSRSAGLGELLEITEYTETIIKSSKSHGLLCIMEELVCWTLSPR